MTPLRSDRAVLVTVGVLAAAVLLAGTGTARAGWDRVSRLLSLQGRPEPASANILSEHEIAGLDAAPPQDQAELLLERSINHFAGANDEIAARVRSWRGRITLTPRLDNLFRTAINSDDLRVRAAGVEVDIAARNLEKTAAMVDRLEPVARTGEQGVRVNALWDLGLIGNRGVEPDRIGLIIASSLHDPNENIRYWAVEGLAYLGTDATIEPLLDVFRDDPSANIRERAACSLAQSGMLSGQQRYRALPRLLDYTEDGSLDAETRTWVYQALRDITGQTLPHDPAAWRQWYASRKGRPAEREPQ
jgi:HEAT repeat protein